MSPLKKTGFITLAIFSMFFAACGGDSTSNKQRDGNNNNQPVVSLSMASSVKAYVGESKTIPVMTQNTDFTVSVSQSGSGCIKSGSNIVCTPTASGNYTVTATATADALKKVSAALTVPELEIITGDGQTLYADDTASATITFNAAGNWTATVSDGSGGVPAWISLDVVRGLAADDSTFELYDALLLQSYDGDDYSEAEAISINGTAGIDDITVMFQPNDGFSADDFTFEFSNDDSMFQSYNGDDYDEEEVSTYDASVSGTAGNNAIKATLQPNDSMADRAASITITTSRGQTKITITQRNITRIGTPLYPEPIWTLSQSSIMFTSATVGYGTQTAQSVTIRNTGTVAITGVNASITNGSANFEITTSPSSPISAGNSSTVGIRPKTGLSAGTYSGTLTVSTANGGSKTVSLSFTVIHVDILEWTLSPLNITFPEATVGYGTQTTQLVTIRNTGNVALTGISASIDCSYFVITTFPLSSLSAGGSSTIGVRPSTGLSVGTYGCTLTISTTNGGNKAVALSFTVLEAPVWELSPPSMTFPTATMGYGTQTCQSVTISNTGNAALTGVSTSITAGSTYFEICASPSSSISAGNSSTVTVRPTTGRSAGTYSGTLTVSTTNGGSKTVSLSFTVTPGSEIRTAAELNDIRNRNLSGEYKLMANISLTSYANWVPIGTASAPFTGKLDGNGYKITGLKITRNTEDYIGLFGYVRSGSITNLVLENVDIQGRSYVGSVAGYIQYGTISGGSSTGLITSYVVSSYSNPYYSGGITGYMEGGTITGATSSVAVTSSVTSSSYSDYKYYSGGIAGYINGGIITGSRSTGNISSVIPYSAYSGGIAGYVATGGEISNSSSTGSVISNSSSNNAVSGGIAGYTNSSEINGSSSEGNISAFAYSGSYSGGITGYATNISEIRNSSSTGNISASFVTSAASDFYAISGGIAGYANGGEISGGSSTGSISSSAPSGGFFTPSLASSGGIAGYATNVRITRSFSMSVAGSISSSAGSGNNPGFSSAFSGGIAGYVNSGRISDCYSARDITTTSSDTSGDTYSGGIAGYASGSIVTNCYSRGNISSTNSSSYADVYSGGIAGYAQGAQINNCAAATSAISAKGGAGRIAGYIDTGNSPAVSNNFTLDTMIATGSAPLNTGSSYHGVSKTDAQLKTQSTYSGAINSDGLGGLGWKFGSDDDNPWKMPSGGGYPILYWQQ